MADRQAQTASEVTTTYVPRVVHLGYFDAVLDGVRAGLTFDQLRLRLITVSSDLARLYSRRMPSQRTDPSVLWTTSRDTLEGLMRSGLIVSQALPSRKEAALAQAETKYSLTVEGRNLLGRPTVGIQREELGVALYRAYSQFRRYLQRLQQGPIFFAELAETELDKYSGDGWESLATEIAERSQASAAHAEYDAGELATSLKEFVERRFQSEGRRQAAPTRKDRLDATLDGIVGFVSRKEGIGADPISLATLHEWARQLFLVGSSRYVAESTGGSLHWMASAIEESAAGVVFRRKTLGDCADEVIRAIGRAYKMHPREGTRLVEFYRLRATAAYLAGVSNDLVDRVTAAMVTGALPNPYGLQPVAGAQFSPPPSERLLRIRDRRYGLVTLTRDPREE